MVTLSNNILILFGAVSLVVFSWLVVRDKQWQSLSLQGIFDSLKIMGVVLVPILGLAFLGTLGGIIDTSAVLYVALGAVSPFVLSQMNLPACSRSILLLALGVLLTSLLPAESYGVPIACTLTGMLAWKAVENLLKKPESTLVDILPVFVWLTGAYWLETAGLGGKADSNEALLLSTLAAGLFFHWVQRPIISEDKQWWKRILLSATGGLFVLIVINKFLVMPAIGNIAALAGAGFFLTYIFEAMDKTDDSENHLPNRLKKLIFIGIFTLLATRLFGMLGLLILAATISVATRPGTAHIAAFFFASRVLLQTFILQFNPNVTGVNITHAYTNAALYAGFLAILLLSVLLKGMHDRRIASALFVAAGIALPVGANYFLHAEPAASLLVSASVAAVLLTIMSAVIYGQDVAEHENIILLPALMTSSAILANALIPMGNEATSAVKMQIMIVLGVFLVSVWIAHYMVFSGPSKQAPAEASGK